MAWWPGAGDADDARPGAHAALGQLVDIVGQLQPVPSDGPPTAVGVEMHKCGEWGKCQWMALIHTPLPPPPPPPSVLVVADYNSEAARSLEILEFYQQRLYRGLYVGVEREKLRLLLMLRLIYSVAPTSAESDKLTPQQ